MIAETERSRIASASMVSRAAGSATYSRPQWTKATTGRSASGLHQPVEQGRRQQVGLRRAVGVDVGQADDIEARQRQHLALAEPWDAGGVERPGRLGIARCAEIHRMVVGEADGGDVEPLQPCGRQFLRHGERHVVDRLRHVGQDDAFEIDDQRPRLGAGEDLAARCGRRPPRRAAPSSSSARNSCRRQNSRSSHWRAAGRCSRVRTCRTG